MFPQKAWFFNNGNPIELDADRNGNKDVPNFYGGFQRGVSKIALPQNAYSQQRAAIGGDPTDTSSVSNREIRDSLHIHGGNPNDPPPTGVYVPNRDGGVSGGIYVQGNAKLVTLSLDSNGNQVYTIKDANNVTCTITLDRAHNQTIVSGGQNPGTYSGIPRGIIYTQGEITDLKGPDRVNGVPPPAIEGENQLLLVAKNDIIIQRDITYEDYDNGKNILGIYSTSGNVRIGTSAPNELCIDAFVMASSYQKVFTVDNYWSGNYRGQVHLRGGVVQNYYGPFGTFNTYGKLTGYGRDFRYDRRGFEPPYYPLTRVFEVDEPIPQVIVWRE